MCKALASPLFLYKIGVPWCLGTFINLVGTQKENENELFHGLFWANSTSKMTLGIQTSFVGPTWNELVLNLHGACFYNCPSSSWTPNFFKQPILGWWTIFFLNQPSLTHLSTIKITINIKPTWMFTHRHMSHAIWRYLDVEKKSKWKVVMFLMCWVFMWGCLPQCKLCMSINDVYSSKNEIFFYVHGKRPFVLTLIT